MSILSLFVVIPALMLLCLWLAKSLNQVRGVMVTGASCLLALSVWLTIYFLQQRAAGNTAEMLLTYSTPWFKPLNIAYSVGVDGISVVMLLLSSIIVFTGTFASWQLKPLTKEYFLWFTLLSTLWLLHLDRPLHDVYVLRGGPDSDVPVDWCLG